MTNDREIALEMVVRHLEWAGDSIDGSYCLLCYRFKSYGEHSGDCPIGRLNLRKFNKESINAN